MESALIPDRIGQAVAAAVARHRLLRGVARAGLAVSGGADSVALFHLLLPLCRAQDVAVTVLHFDHGLRAESKEDARFVQTLAAESGVPCITGSASGTPAHPVRPSLSLEMAARAARLAFFQKCAADAALDAVATGHNADDEAETLLLRLARGAGATGLSGLRPRSHVRGKGTEGAAFIRPLLSVPGKDLRAWLAERGLTWREDASNRDTAIPRNLVRHTLLPQLEQAWGTGLRARLCRSAEILREDDALLEELAERRLEELVESGAWMPSPAEASPCLSPAGEGARAPDLIPVAALLREPTALQRRMLRLWLFRQGQPEAAGFEPVQRLLERCREPDGWRLTLPGGAVAVCRGGVMEITGSAGVPPANGPCDASAGGTPALPVTLPVPTLEPLRWGDLEITAESARGIHSASSGIGRYPAVCALSAEALNGLPLTVRTRRPGDRIAPTGMAGSKKLQDLFVDAKLPEPLRDAVPLVVCGDEIAWVPGYRVARRFAVPSANAESVKITVSIAKNE